MNLSFRSVVLLVLPLLAACSGTPGLVKKDPGTAPREPAVFARDLDDAAQPARQVKNSLAKFCSLSCGSPDDSSPVSKGNGRLEGIRNTASKGRSFSGVTQGPEKRSEVPHLKFPVASGCLSSPFGYRHGVFHGGLDITAAKGAPIVACEAGEVLHAGSRKGYRRYGKSVIVDHGKGVFTHYAHASRILVRPGQKVRKGQTIALVGSTGRATCPHLHLEVQVENRLYNPMDYFTHQELSRVEIARNFSNKPSGPVIARRRLSVPISLGR